MAVTWVSLLSFLVLRNLNSPSLSRRERLLLRPEPGVEVCLGAGEGMGFSGEVEGNLDEVKDNDQNKTQVHWAAFLTI